MRKGMKTNQNIVTYDSILAVLLTLDRDGSRGHTRAIDETLFWDQMLAYT